MWKTLTKKERKHINQYVSQILESVSKKLIDQLYRACTLHEISSKFTSVDGFSH